MRKYIANIITGFRFLGSVSLLFFQPYSTGFYIIYLLCGFSDMIDGTIARKTNGASKFGAKLDTAADLVFVAVCLFKLLPSIQIPAWLWIWVAAISVLKIGNLIWGFIAEKQLMYFHTMMNKITGLLLFLLPLTLPFVEPIYCCTVVCITATLSAIQEWYYILTKREAF